MTIPAGMQAKVVLLDAVSASRSRLGDAFHARLIEPVSISSNVVIPAGSVLEGVVAKAQKPRMLSRSGSLLLSFTSIRNSEGAAKRIDASIAGLSLDSRSHTKIDPSLFVTDFGRCFFRNVTGFSVPHVSANFC